MTPAESENDARRRVAAENRRSAEVDEREALYHAAMALCLSSVGDREEARTERGRATVLRRAAQIKRDLAQQYDPQREAASQPLHLVAAGSSRDNLATRRWSGDPLRG
jgi:hypothetical protein